MKNYSSLLEMLTDLAAEGLTSVSLNGVSGFSLEGEYRAYEVRWGNCELAVLDHAEGWMQLGYAAHPSGLPTPPAGAYFGHLPQAFSLAEAQALRAEYSLYHPHVIVLGDAEREQYWIVTEAEATRLAAAGYDQHAD
ncbi:hypothetical protein [Deinococcus sp. Leaf326]|uniref:hypothetical protein n=1 Tax=Deinococcus sp. Leaf326 TaxID=1736338 RepID=UPI0006F4CB28|nr:hypothetical protein [Deinococcus sp. Leaf326]KQR37805.1 hypothetical protein ASF71_15095 [Deinococcus sp. Leaf326]